MRRAEQAIPRTHRSVPHNRPMCRLEGRLVAAGEVATAALLRAVCRKAAGTQDPAPDERYRAGVDPSRLLSFRGGNGSLSASLLILGSTSHVFENHAFTSL